MRLTTTQVPLVLAGALSLALIPHANGEQLDERDLTLRQGGDCATNPAWQATTSAWIAADTDSNLEAWWLNVSSVTHGSFAHELGSQFGSHLNDFRCGIGLESTCSSQGCLEYQNSGDQPWSYLAVLAVVNLNTFFNAMATGVTNGQIDYEGLVDEMTLLFFPWKNPHFVLGDASFWIVAVITALATLGTLGAVEVGATLVGIAAFAGAAVQQVTLCLTPGNGFPAETVTKLSAFASSAGSYIRQSLDDWANSTFAGVPDAENHTILDYLKNGSYLGNEIPSSSDMEQFYKKQLVGRTVNSEWRTQKTFIYFARTDNPNDVNGPDVTKYYSKEDGGFYYLYRYVEDGILKGHLDKPWGLDSLNGPHYNISPSDVTISSARAWRRAGFNYTQEIAQNRILDSIDSDGKLTPFLDGASWEGVFTIPVCDVGNHTNWIAQYGRKKNRYDYLPCCCGPSCNDTKAFVEASNLNGFQTLLRGCKGQMKAAGMDFSEVDYGFKWKNSLPLYFAAWPLGVKIAFVVGFPVAIALLLACCACL